MARFKKSDIEYHVIGYGGNSLPAVNVKVYSFWRNVSLPLDLCRTSDDGGTTWYDVTTDPDFTVDWIETNVPEGDFDEMFQSVCESGWEWLKEIATDIFGPRVRVFSEGRSGGWAVVDGLSDPEGWDAIELSRWAKFARAARAAADDIPRQTVETVYANYWQEGQAMDMDEFLSGYLECAVWASHDMSQDTDGGMATLLDANYDTDDFSDDALAEIKRECEDFISSNADDLDVYCDHVSVGSWTAASQAGHDFFLTRNRHGVGYWDRCPPSGAFHDACQRLTDAAHVYGETNYSPVAGKIETY